MKKGQESAARRTSVDDGLSLRISAQPGPAFVEGAGYEIPAEVVSGLRQMLTGPTSGNRWPQVVAMTAAVREEGVSYTAMSVSAVLNRDTGNSVCLVDTNWYWPSVPLANSPGLAGVIAGTTELEEALVWVKDGELLFLPAGQMPQDRRAASARSPALKATIARLRRHFKYVILDVPPVLVTSDAVALAGLADACCLVVRQGVTPLANVRQALDAIRHLQVMGVIMNDVRLHMPAGLAGQLTLGWAQR